MRHRKKRLSLNRSRSWRKATLRDMSKNLLIYQSIRTTLVKAKSVKIFAEKLITLGKKDTLASRRAAFGILQDHSLVKLLFTTIAPQFKNIKGGYTRILSLKFRRGDGAKIVILELTKKVKLKKTTSKKEQVHPELKESVPEPAVKSKEEAVVEKRSEKKFLGGLRKIFKKQKDAGK